jgi:hypothetical protein
LNAKTPKRSASWEDLEKAIERKIKNYKKICFDTFLEKDKINYDYAIGQYENAELLQRALHLMEAELQKEFDING